MGGMVVPTGRWLFGKRLPCLQESGWQMTGSTDPYPASMIRFVCFLLLVSVFVPSCQPNSGSEPSTQERAAIVAEINQRLAWYRDAVMRRDLEEYLGFWSDSEDFVFAGDGRILGGYDDWAELTAQHNAETEKWLKWEYRNVHVAVLSRDAASCTTEIEMSKLNVDGSTLRLKVAWTYVFKKFGDTWKVIHSNGTHVEL
jgi:ketosteroid isomerase-like protein